MGHSLILGLIFHLTKPPPFVSNLNLIGCVGIADNQRLFFIWQAVSASSGQGTVQQASFRRVHGEKVEHSATNDTAMHLDDFRFFRQWVSREVREKNCQG